MTRHVPVAIFAGTGGALIGWGVIGPDDDLNRWVAIIGATVALTIVGRAVEAIIDRLDRLIENTSKKGNS